LEKLAAEALIVRWPGLLDEAAAQAWRENLAAEAGTRALALNMTHVHWLTSLELGALLALTQACRARGSRLFLLGVRHHARRLLEFCRLDRYLDLVDTPEQLSHAMRAARGPMQAGSLERDRTRRLRFALPVELTAANLPQWRERWNSIWANVEQDVSEVVIDGAATRFLDSAALGFLVGIKKAVDQQRLTWRCGGFGSAVRQVMKIARLDALLLTD
jgi:anti-anti-sigma factor